jgi:glycosyltransferase involved in cell wall biosynthesis
VQARITWHGTVASAGRLMQAFDCFVLSSRTEGTPIVLLEAMAARVPVVATRVGGVPDVVTENEALLVPREDPEAIGHAIRRIITDPASAAQRAEAALHRLADFQPEPWLEKYESVYAAICRWQ